MLAAPVRTFGTRNVPCCLRPPCPVQGLHRPWRPTVRRCVQLPTTNTYVTSPARFFSSLQRALSLAATTTPFPLRRRPSDRLSDRRGRPRDGQAALKEQSKGKLGVKVFPTGALGAEHDTIEQLKIGGLDMMRINVAAAQQHRARDASRSRCPFVFRSVEHMRKVLDGPIGDEILAAMEAQGMVGLAFYDSGARSFYTVKKPDQDAGRPEGHEDPRAAVRPVRRDDGGAGRQRDADALSARCTPALKTGIVDGAENNWPSYESSRHFEAAKYYNVTEHSMVPEVLVFSKKIWDTLVQGRPGAALRKAAKDSVPYMRKLWDEREAKSRKVAEAGGRAGRDDRRTSRSSSTRWSRCTRSSPIRRSSRTSSSGSRKRSSIRQPGAPWPRAMRTPAVKRAVHDLEPERP